MAISGGGSHICGLRSYGYPVCWGDNSEAQSSAPKHERFVAISSGKTHTCGLRGDQSVVCWGWRDFGQASPPE